MSKTKHYYRTKAKIENLEVEYNSEEDEIYIRFEHRLERGDLINSDHMKIHPSYIEPLYKLLKEVAPPQEAQE